ncbi:MAG: hypothetical protein JWN17_1812 [Frankiales bacterium]|nr:hypothetical protein [Frankiales bacterium]
MRAAGVVLLLAVTACGGGQPASPAPEHRPRVDSALCDDLREASAKGAPDAARRVLVTLGAAPVAPEDVVAALHDVEGGASPDDGRDAVLAAYVDDACGGR